MTDGMVMSANSESKTELIDETVGVGSAGGQRSEPGGRAQRAVRAARLPGQVLRRVAGRGA
jgi:hypothetical protein